MQIVSEYISMNYMTLMLLVGLIVILIANRRTKIDGMQYIWTITGLVFVLTICEYAEVWCDTYNKPVWILYLKAAISYAIPPLLILLELYLVAPIQHKLLLFLPFLADVILIITDLFGTNLIYGYSDTHDFVGGKLHFFPALILCFYVLLLLKFSLGFLHNKEYSKAMIVIFMALSTIVTVLLEEFNIIIDHTAEIAALEILIYYFYIAAIHHSQIQNRLYKSELELERQHNALLMAQIQPHFINNSLLAIQARCMDYPEIYDSMKHFSRYLRSNFENMEGQHAITFAQELKHIKAYLALEKLNFGERLHVEYDIDSDAFMLPALTVEPLVENAVRHGIAARENGGTVQIIQRDEEDGITIEVRDSGSGRLHLTEKQEKRRGIGVANVRARLAVGNRGNLELIPAENGTCARITLNHVIYQGETEDSQ